MGGRSPRCCGAMVTAGRTQNGRAPRHAFRRCRRGDQIKFSRKHYRGQIDQMSCRSVGQAAMAT